MTFTDFDSAAFLRDTWQKAPLLIRNPWGAWHNPLGPDELIELAGEDDVEARLVMQTPKRWKVEHGPFDAGTLGKRRKHPWSLLVQAVDQAVPDVADLIEPFRFIPNWRIDDVMVSLASDGGGVGPHFDQYDVFLIQGHGRRRWQVGQWCDDASALRDGEDLRLLADFTATDEWLLEPGDMLYVPPRLAHNGIALGDDCMTYSIGFRAPARSALMAHWCDEVLSRLTEDDRYADPDLALQTNPGEIAPAAIDRLHAMVTAALGDRAAFARWFGGYTSAPKYPDLDWQPEAPATDTAIRAALAARTPLLRNPASRFAFVRQDALTLLFVDGVTFDCTGAAAALAEALCAQSKLTLDAALAEDAAAVALLGALFNQGSVAFDD